MSSLFKESDLPKDFLFQVGSLFVSILVVHTIYLLFIDPAATLQVATAQSENRAPTRTLAIILKDFEQETCIMLAIWALSIIFIKWQRIKEQTQILTLNILGDEADEYLDLEKIVLIEEELDKQEKGLITNALLAGIHGAPQEARRGELMRRIGTGSTRNKKARGERRFTYL